MDYQKFDPKRYSGSAASLSIAQGDLVDIKDALPKAKGAALLEVGCGSGTLLAVLRRHGYGNLLGLESCEEAAARASSTAGCAVLSINWEDFVRGSQEKFDAILALDVLEHLPPASVPATLAYTISCLRPGGRLIIRTPNPECPFSLWLLYSDLTHNRMYSPRLLVHLLTRISRTLTVRIWSPRPHKRVLRLIHVVSDYLLLRPLFTLLFYWFFGQRPRSITANYYLCATLQ